MEPIIIDSRISKKHAEKQQYIDDKLREGMK